MKRETCSKDKSLRTSDFGLRTSFAIGHLLWAIASPLILRTSFGFQLSAFPISALKSWSASCSTGAMQSREPREPSRPARYFTQATAADQKSFRHESERGGEEVSPAGAASSTWRNPKSPPPIRWRCRLHKPQSTAPATQRKRKSRNSESRKQKWNP